MGLEEVSANIWQAANPHKNDCLGQENSGAYLCGPLRDWHRLGQRVKHLLAHIAYAWPYVCSIHHAATLPCPCSCSSSARAKQTNSAIFSAPSADACSERANQLVSNTFRLLIITLRQARHQYEGYWRILKDTAWTLGSCSINGSNGCSAFHLPCPHSALSYGRHGAYCSYLIITFLFTLQSRSWSWSRRRMLSASGLFICAICLSARQLITFAFPLLLSSPSLLFSAFAVLALSAFHRPLA